MTPRDYHCPLMLNRNYSVRSRPQIFCLSHIYFDHIFFLSFKTHFVMTSPSISGGEEIQFSLIFIRISNLLLSSIQYNYCRHRGLAIIINNFTFSTLPDRRFSGKDKDSLLKALKYVGFRQDFIRLYDNQTKDQMMDIVQKGNISVNILNYHSTHFVTNISSNLVPL